MRSSNNILGMRELNVMSGLFSLPPELRARVWEYCMPEPRNILISSKQLQQPTPVVFHICHESRSEASKTYERALPAFYTQSAKHQIWINFAKDRLCIDDQAHLWRTQSPREDHTDTFGRVQSLGFEFRSPQNFVQLADILTVVNCHQDNLSSLKEVVLYSRPPKRGFEDQNGRVQLFGEASEDLDEKDTYEALLTLLRMLFDGHADYLGFGGESPPPIRWQHSSYDGGSVFAGRFAELEKYDYAFRCAGSGVFETQSLSWAQLGLLTRVTQDEMKRGSHKGYKACPYHPWKPVECT